MTIQTIQPKSKDAVAWTGECPITYVNLDTPREPSFEGQKPQYQCIVLIDKEETLKAVGDAIQVAKEKLTDTDPAVPLATLLKDGDERTDRNGDPVEAFKGKWYFTAKNSERPNVYKLTDRGAEPAAAGQGAGGRLLQRLRLRGTQGCLTTAPRILQDRDDTREQSADVSRRNVRTPRSHGNSHGAGTAATADGL